MTYIFESPDGGHTVYRRRARETTRELVSEDEWAQSEKLKREWMTIFDKRDTNPTLQKAVEQVIILYRLGSNYEQSC